MACSREHGQVLEVFTVNELLLGLGVATAAFILMVLLYVRRLKSRMRRSVLRFERIKNKLED